MLRAHHFYMSVFLPVLTLIICMPIAVGAVFAVPAAGAPLASPTAQIDASSAGGALAMKATSSSTSSFPWFLFLLGLLVIAGAGLWINRKNKMRRQKNALPVASLEELENKVGQALIDADDALHSANEELAYAQAQFGVSATDDFSQAILSAQTHMERAFTLRKLLDDDQEETPAQKRQMYGEILEKCQQATQIVRAQAQVFRTKRGQEASVPELLADATQRGDEAEQKLRAAATLLLTLQAAYPDSMLESVLQAPAQGQRLLAAGRTAITQAQQSWAEGQAATALEQARIARSAITQATQCAQRVVNAQEQLEHAADRLQTAITSISADLVDVQRLHDALPQAVLEPLVADAQAAIQQGQQVLATNTASGDPLAALAHLGSAESALDAALQAARTQEENDSRARLLLHSRLERLSAQVESVNTYIATHRGVIGASARTALSEATRHHHAALALQNTDPSGALAEVDAGEPLIAQAQALAEADVRGGERALGNAGAVSRGGLDLAPLLLGGILLTNLGNHGNRHR